MTEYQRGRDTSHALTEIRTVLSRAETALQWFDATHGRESAGGTWSGNTYTPNPPYYDPDASDMADALGEIVRLLDKWRRTGRSK